jgi:1-deoxyxylulose-5-phosphate synthase
MKFRQLGASDLTISELSLGCMSLPLDEAKAAPIVHAALDAGINYFDTADLYNKGANETLVGKLLKPHRQQLYIATKVGNKFSQDADGWSWDASPEHITKSVKESLSRLQTDYIDLYQLHGGTTDDNFEEIIDTFETLKKEGYIREYGISSIRPNVFLPFSESNAVSNMMQYNMLDRCAEEYFDVLQENGVSVVTRGSVAKGLLTADWRQKLKAYMNYSQEEVQAVLEAITQYGDIHSLALAFNLQHPAVASTVIGASSAMQLQQTITAYNALPLSIEKEMIDLLKEDRYTAHR